MTRRSLQFALLLALLLDLLLPPTLVAESTLLRGTVLRPDGAAIAEARIEIAPVSSSFETLSAILETRHPEQTVATVRTDAKGRFVLKEPGFGVWQVKVSAEGFVPMRFAPLPLANPVELPPVTLRPAIDAPIDVTDAAGKPLAGVGVYAQSADRDVLQQTEKNAWRPAPRRGWTDAAGRLRLPRAQGERLDIWAYRPGQAQVGANQTSATQAGATQAHAAGVRTATLILNAHDATAERVKVQNLFIQDPSGAPIADVIAAAADTAWPLGRAGQDGAVSVNERLSEPLRLVLLAPRSRIRTVTLEPIVDDTARTPITLPLSVTMTGRIVDPNGAPVAGALVWPGHDPGAFTRSDKEGLYTLHGGAGERVLVQAHGYGLVPSSRRLTFSEQSFSPADLVLSRAASLTGRVVDEAGLPIDEAQLTMTFQGERPPAVRPDPADSRSMTDPQGRFRLPNLTPEGSYTLTVGKPGFNASALTVKTPFLGEELEVVLQRGRLAFGRVLDLEERPLAGAEVRLRAAEQNDTAAARGLRQAESSELPLAVSDAAGRFEMRALPAERWDLVASAPGFAPFTVRGIQVPAGDSPVDLGTVLLEPGVAIHGQVRDRDGEPVAASVWIVEDPQQALRTRRGNLGEGRPSQAEPTGSEPSRVRLNPAEQAGLVDEADAVADASGTFTLEGLEPGRGVALYVDGSGYLPTTLEVTPPLPESVQVVLAPASQISGRVIDSNGAAIPGAEIKLYPAEPLTPEAEADPASLGVERFRHAVTSNEQGHFTIEGVAPGAIQVEVFARGFLPPPLRTFEIAEKQDISDLRFVLDLGARLEGRVTTADFEPVARARVFLGQPQDHSDGEGAYRVAGLPTGRQFVEVRHPGYNLLVREIDIENGVNAADFILEGGHRISGTAIDTSDLPVAEVEIEIEPVGLGDPSDGGDASAVMSSPGETYRVKSDTRGGFLVDPAAGGTYRVRAYRRGYVQVGPEAVIQVADEPLDDVEIRMQTGTRIEGQVLGLEIEELSRVKILAEAEGRRSQAGEVDFSGSYQIPDLAADDWSVKAFLAGGRREIRARVAVESGVEVVNRDLEFGRGVTLTGQVLYENEPLAETLVEIRGHTLAGRRAVTSDFEGLFQVEDLEPGNYRLRLSNHRQQLIHNEDLTLANDRDVVIEIETAGLAGTVVDRQTGDSVASASVALKQLLPGDQEGSLFTVATDAEGRFNYRRLTAGRFRLTVQSHDYQTTERQVEVPVGSVLDELQVLLEPAVGLEVTVELSSGRRPEYITLYGRDDNGGSFAETRPAYEGTVPFSTLPAGNWDLLIGATGGTAVEKRLTVPAEPLSLVVPDAGRVKVRVPALVETDTVAMLTVHSQDNRAFRHLAWGGNLEQSWQVVGGRATVQGIPAGSWTFQVRSPDGQTWSGVATTTGGPDVAVDLE